MSTIAAEVSPLFQRVERETRKPRAKVTAEDRLVDEALAAWAQWLREYLLPRDSTHRPPLGTVFEAAVEACTVRSSPRTVNPTLAAILAQERSLTAWPISIHRLVFDMPRTHAFALLGDALGYSQALTAEYIGVSQPRICLVLKQGRRTLAISLAVLRHVERAHNEIIRHKAR